MTNFGVRCLVAAFVVSIGCVGIAAGEYGDGTSWWKATPYQLQSKKAIAGGSSRGKLDAFATGWANGVTGSGLKVKTFLETNTRTVEQSAVGIIRIAPAGSVGTGRTYSWVASMEARGGGTAEVEAAKGGTSEALCANQLLVMGHLYCHLDRKAEAAAEVTIASEDTMLSDSATWTATSASSNQGTGPFYVSSLSRARGKVSAHAFNPLKTAGAQVDRLYGWVKSLLGLEDLPTAEQVAQELLGHTTARAQSHLGARIGVETRTRYANGQGFHTVFGIEFGRVSGTGKTGLPGGGPVEDAKPGEVEDDSPLPPLPPEYFGNDPDDQPPGTPHIDGRVPLAGDDDTPATKPATAESDSESK